MPASMSCCCACGYGYSAAAVPGSGDRGASGGGASPPPSGGATTVPVKKLFGIIRELNNGDTAFVLRPTAADHDIRVRFFTPRTEAAFVGHATIAAHAVLALRAGLHVADVVLDGAEVVVLGRGNIVGKPMASILVQKAAHANCTVTVCHSATPATDPVNIG